VKWKRTWRCLRIGTWNVLSLYMGCREAGSSSSSSVRPVANATDVVQPSRLIVLTLSHNDARDPSSKRWKYVGEN